MAGAAFGPIGAAAGGVIGAGASLISGIGAGSAASKQRRRVRRGINAGQNTTSRQVGAIMNSPEIQAMQDFLYGLYGINPNSPSGAQGLGSAQTLEGRSVVDTDASTTGKTMKSLGKQGMRSVMDATKKLSEYDRAKRLAESGVELSPAEQARVDASLASAESGELVKLLEGMSGIEQNWVARKLQDREGIGADDFNQLYSGIREAAGLPQKEQQQGGANFANALDPSINPMAGNFQKSIQQAQASRGLFASNVAAGAEASGMSAFIFGQQQANLGNLQNLATLDVGGFAQQLGQYNIQNQVALSTGGQGTPGPNVAGQVAEGALAGIMGGAKIGLQMAQTAGTLFGSGAQADQGNPLKNFNPMGKVWTPS